MLSLKRKLRRGPFERTQFDALGRALPYLRATANAAAAAYNHSLGNELESLARAGFGAALLDQGGRVITSNAELQLGDGLIMVAGELRAAHRDDQAALESAIRLALRPEHPSRLPPPRRAIVRRRLSRHPLLVDVLPLIGASGVSLFRAAAMLVVTDLSRSVSPEISELRHVFGLTTREAQLAARLATGMPLESAANELHISTSHARQRLKAIFQKTDTHRQAELTALLARLSRLHLPRR